MGKHLDEKSLMVVNEKSILYKIKTFFLRLFKKNEIVENVSQTSIESNQKQVNDIKKDTFMESIKKIENEETKLLKLQKQFDNGEIDKSQLSKEQVADLTALYKKQINDLEQSNERRINKIKEKIYNGAYYGNYKKR